MDGERQPLLAGPSKHKSSVRIFQKNDSSESLSIILGSIYGTEGDANRKIVPMEERITYTWNELNAFVMSTESKRRKYFCFGEATVVSGVPKKHILKNVSGIGYPGELLAILGTSGTGKTTLLNALTFRSTKGMTITGTRCVNGIPVNLNSITSVSAYVQQNDLFLDTLTVREHLIFQALVRMDKTISYQQRMKRVTEVLNELSLKKCENSIIGKPGQNGISGGERKRLSFAAEVLTNPSLMFCDEPTSGLDSFMALNVVEVLKSMAHTGKTVICTIHQPSSELYALFDRILLLAEGRVLFLGTPEEADIFFTELEAPCPRNYNPADYYIQLMAVVPGREESCKQAINMICNRYERSETGVRVAVESKIRSTDLQYVLHDTWSTNDFTKSPYKASWYKQFRAVLWRSWLSILKDPVLMKIRFSQTALVSLIIGIIFYGQKISQDGVMNINGALFLFLTNMTFQNVFAVIHVFSSELQVFLRENKNGMYRTDVYFVSKTLAEAPVFIAMPVVFTSICYYMVGLNSENFKFLIASGIVILVTNVATSFGYMISCLSGTTTMALSVGSPAITPFLIFGGFFLNVNSIPIYFKWLSYLSWFKYGNEALMINQWEGITHIDCPTTNSTVCPSDGHIVLATFNFYEENFPLDVISLFLLIPIFRLTAFVGLLWRTYK